MCCDCRDYAAAIIRAEKVVNERFNTAIKDAKQGFSVALFMDLSIFVAGE